MAFNGFTLPEFYASISLALKVEALPLSFLLYPIMISYPYNVYFKCQYLSDFVEMEKIGQSYELQYFHLKTPSPINIINVGEVHFFGFN